MVTDFYGEGGEEGLVSLAAFKILPSLIGCSMPPRARLNTASIDYTINPNCFQQKILG